MEGEFRLGKEKETIKTDELDSFSSVFEKVFPKFLAIGMSEEQFWDKDPYLTRAFIEADKVRLERTNSELWLQGRYIYEALLCCAPVLNALSKKHRAEEYRRKPYNLTKERQEEDRYEQNKARMEAFAIAFNKRYEMSEDG